MSFEYSNVNKNSNFISTFPTCSTDEYLKSKCQITVFIYSQLLERYEPFESSFMNSLDFILVKIPATKYEVNTVCSIDAVMSDVCSLSTTKNIKAR